MISLRSFWRQIEDSLLVMKIGSCEHTLNDLLTFSPQKRNLEIGPSESLLPVFGTKNRILKIGSLSFIEPGANLAPLLRTTISIMYHTCFGACVHQNTSINCHILEMFSANLKAFVNLWLSRTATLNFKFLNFFFIPTFDFVSNRMLVDIYCP